MIVPGFSLVSYLHRLAAVFGGDLGDRYGRNPVAGIRARAIVAGEQQSTAPSVEQPASAVASASPAAMSSDFIRMR